MSEWEEIPTHDFMLAVIPDEHTFRRRTSDGTLTVMAGTEPDGFHLSISHPRRYPSWDEICDARDRFTPADKTMVQLLPPRDRWVNAHDNCFHLWEQLSEVEAIDRLEAINAEGLVLVAEIDRLKALLEKLIRDRRVPEVAVREALGPTHPATSGIPGPTTRNAADRLRRLMECAACGRKITNDTEAVNAAAWTLTEPRLPYCGDSPACQRDVERQWKADREGMASW